jgi:S1-C subfamily serine protease
MEELPSEPPIPQPKDPDSKQSYEQPKPRDRKTKPSRLGAVLAVILLVGLLGGGLIGYSLSYATFNGKINEMQTQLQNLPPTNATYVSYANTSFLIGENVSLASLYQQVKSSVVIIQNLIPQYNIFGFLRGYSQQQGSGFVALVDNEPVIVTNNHVMQGAVNATVSFANGDSYPATLLGSDPLADLAVLKLDQAASSDLQPLTIVSSQSLQVGDPVVAVGSPYGLSGTLTTGVVSALGRTITETDGSGNGGINIPDVIQTSTAINPGNSGGPLVNYRGEVVGITTAAVSNSEGLGFAIPSETILREISSLVRNGSYDNHPTINAVGTDMDYHIAQAIGIDATYGWLVESVSVQNGLKGGTSQVVAGASSVVIGGDVIIGVNGTRISNVDDLLSYLEQNTFPGQKVDFNVIRSGQAQTIQVTIGKLSV